ncbi:MAG: aldo/keto reductase [Eubacterium sp.]|nr:aldo/keto reductase [Eubacterium sp.]
MAKKLGFGLMRLPENGAEIDVKHVEKMVDLFMERGFTYFDTAWMYCNFRSEEVTKKALVERHPRDSFTLATKLHSGFIQKIEDRDKVFNEQLRKTGVEYFDYYLIHDVNSHSIEVYDRLDVWGWIKEKKETGLIREMGFSFHDGPELLDRVLTEHPEMEFVQLQINYLDWNSTGIQSRKCYEVATKHGKPVTVMEPVKGGTLAAVPEAVVNLFKEYAPEASIPSWAIRFAASLPNVRMVLSGMSNIEQVDDNTSFMQDLVPLNEEEQKRILQAVAIINRAIEIPCTGCRYCVDGCPMYIPIPDYFTLYNAEKQEVASKGWTPQQEYYANFAKKMGKASDCIRCGQCEGICPQHLPIIEDLTKVAALFE